MAKLDTEKIKESIKKTGFVVEYEITKVLKNHKWNVISNKYYLDDVEGVAREIDLIAYKTENIEELKIYTALIISCKKSEENYWAFLVRDLDHRDPNIDLMPIKNWSNDKIANYVINSDGWITDYATSLKKGEIFDKIIEPDDHLFAFQEINKVKYTIQNDKNIFSSVSSLMKAQDYELSSLERRKKIPSLYFFYLVSIVDSDLVRIHFKDEVISIDEIDHAKYLINYIVNKKETQSKIHFICFKTFKEIIQGYNKLHNCNSKYYEECFRIFYKDLPKDQSKIELLIEDFKSDFKKRIFITYRKLFKKAVNFEGFHLDFDDDASTLYINFAENDEEADVLNSDEKIISSTSKSLKEIFRYDGDFKFFVRAPF
jgi:hypothetical protein